MRGTAIHLVVARAGGMRGRFLATALYKEFDAVVFDKDGTLMDFNATWDPATLAAIRGEAPDDEERQRLIGDALGFDLDAKTCVAGAPLVHVANGATQG